MKRIMKTLSCLVVVMLLINTVDVIAFAFEPIPTKMHLEDTALEWYTTDSLTAKLADENAVPLSEKEVWFYQKTPEGWHELGSNLTNDIGIAKYQIFVTLKDGEYLFKAIFRGDNTHAPSQDIATVTVVKNIPIPLILFGVSLAYGIAEPWLEEFVAPRLDGTFGISEEGWKGIFTAIDWGLTIASFVAIPGSAVGAKHATSFVKAAGKALGGQYAQVTYKKIIKEGGKSLLKKGVTLMAKEVSKKAAEEAAEDEDTILNQISPTVDEAFVPYFDEAFSEVDREHVTIDQAIDPDEGYTQPIEVPEGCVRMRSYIRWDFPACPAFKFYALKDPSGKEVTPDYENYLPLELCEEHVTAYEIRKNDPTPGTWTLWLNGSLMGNWKTDITTLFDQWVKIYPEIEVVSPGKTSTHKVMVTNFGSEEATIDLSLSNVPAGWDASLSNTSMTLSPDTSELTNLTITVPDTATRNATEQIIVDAEFPDGHTYSETCTVYVPYGIEILSPTAHRPAIVGDPTHPVDFMAKVSTYIPFVPVQEVDISGIPPGCFKAKIGGKQAEVTVLPSYTENEKGIYTLLITPPSQADEGSYDLEISLNLDDVVEELDVETEAITYSTGAKVDVMEIIDRSGSMSGEKIRDAKDAAKLFVDLMSIGDMIGVASYSSSARVDYGLTEITSDTIKQNAKNAIDRISAGGSTSIGAGLRAGYNELAAKGNPAHPWAMILMSDGLHNTSPHPDTVLPDIRDKNIRCFTIGLGAGADASLLSHIAHDSGAGGGEYYFAPSSEELNAIYNMLAGVVKAESVVKEVKGSLELGETISHKVEIDPTIYMATFTVTWTTGTLELKLIGPDGSEVDPADPDVFHKKEATYETYEIRYPMAGEWTMEITATSTSSSVSYTATVTAGTNLTTHMYTDKDEYLLNEPIKLTAALTKAGEPITEATINVTVERPDAAIDHLSLYDDGKHGDGVALDGVYANYYWNTYVSGSYTINIYAFGTASPDLFTREVRKSVYVSGEPTGKISVAPTSWDAGTITPGQDATSVFAASSTSIIDETVTISATDFTDASGNVIKSDNLFGMPSTFIVPADGSTEFYARIYVPKDTPTGNYTGSMILMSTANSVTIPINLTVLILHEVSISITPSTSTIKPGQTSTYTLSVTNLGSVQDTYNLTVTFTDFNGLYRAYPTAIQPSWTTLNPTSLTLNPEESANATLTITAPPEWAGMEDATYNFTVTAICQADPTVTASATATLTVQATKHSMAKYIKLELIWLNATVTDLDIKEDVKAGLIDKITDATKKVDQAIEWIKSGKETQANNMLNAAQNIIEAFIRLTRAQRNKAIPTAIADDLTTKAQEIIEDIENTKSTPIN